MSGAAGHSANGWPSGAMRQPPDMRPLGLSGAEPDVPRPCRSRKSRRRRSRIWAVASKSAVDWLRCVAPRSGSRGRGALGAPRQDPGTQPVPQFGRPPIGIKHLLVDTEQPGDVAATGIGLECAQVGNDGTQALDRWRKALGNQPLLARFNDCSSGRKGMLGMILNADEVTWAAPDLCGLDVAHAV